tara:strand:+ start:13393 stop:13761 length:369 start_codon:yes stop_codon:yes gene_type:complete
MTTPELLDAVRSCEDHHGGDVTAKQLSDWIECTVRFARTILRMVEGIRTGQKVARGQAEFARAVHDGLDAWVPASSGTELPGRSKSGRRVLRVYNPRRMRHAHLDLDTDAILSEEDSDDAQQ